MYTNEELFLLENQTMIIYKIENLANGKVYIGQTKKTFNKRYSASRDKIGIERVLCYYEQKGNCKNKHLHNAIKKYGTINFKVSILEVCDTREELNEKEIYYINLYEALDNRKGYNRAAGGHYGGVAKWDFHDYAKQKYMWFGMYSLEYFEELIENGYNEMDLADELFRKSIVMVKTWGDTKKYYIYNNAKECVYKLDGKYSLKDVFIICQYTNNCKEKWCKLKNTKVPSGVKFYYSENIKLTKDVKFENYGEGLKENIEKQKELTKYKNERKKEQKRRSKEKRKEQQKTVKTCKRCGKPVNGCRYCADCNMIVYEERKKEKAIKDGKEIKLCPICGKEHWRTQTKYCSRRCSEAAKKKK